MSWGRGFGSARFDHFFQNRSERFGLLEVDVVPGSGNNAARNCALGFRAKVGENLAVFRVELPRQVVYGNAAPRKLAKRANRFLLWGHHVGTCSLEGEREQFRVISKASHPESFLLVSRKMLLAFEQGQTRPPIHESEHPFVSHARRPREVALAQRFTRGIVDRPKTSAFENEGCDRIQAAISTARSEGCGASERSAVELAAAPQVVRSKTRRPKRHAPAHGVPNQNGRHTCVARNDPTKSKERSRLEAQVEEVRALRGVAASRAGARPMPRKLETETLNTRICK